MHPVVARIIDSKPGRALMNGAIKLAKSQPYTDAQKTVEGASKTVKLVPKNPGRAVRRMVAGTIKDPSLTIAEGVDVGLSFGVPEYNAIPLNAKMAAGVFGRHIPKPGPKVQRYGNNYMRINGQTQASRAGNRTEYYTNKLVLGLGELGQKLPM